MTPTYLTTSSELKYSFTHAFKFKVHQNFVKKTIYTASCQRCWALPVFDCTVQCEN